MKIADAYVEPHKLSTIVETLHRGQTPYILFDREYLLVPY